MAILLTGIQLCAGALAQTSPTATSTRETESVELKRGVGDLSAVGQGAQRLPVWALMVQDKRLEPAQVLGMASTFVAFEPKRVYEFDGQVLWLKIKLSYSADDDRHWTLSLPKAFLDRVELYTPDVSGAWQRQIAGDNVAHYDWTWRTLKPQFMLPRPVAGDQTVLIKITQDFPQQIPLLLIEEQRASELSAQDFIIAGWTMGILCLIIALSIHLACTYRDRAYAWYAVYAVCGLLSLASFLGVSSYYLWPGSSWWPEYSILFLMMLCLASMVWFCQLMFLRSMEAPILRRVAYGVVGTTLFLALAYMLLPKAQHRVNVFSLAAFLCILTNVVIVVRAWRNRQAAAKYWLIAFLPLVVSVLLALAENLNLISPTGLPYAMPAFALCFEALVLLSALHRHAKNRHALEVRERALQFVDPLTGFLNPQTFNDKLKRVWKEVSKAGKSYSDVSVAYIHLHHQSTSRDSDAALRMERRLLRSVRSVGFILRDVDFAGRLGGQALAVCFPGVPLGDELNNRLARIVALGQITDQYDPQALEIRYRIAVGSYQVYEGDLKALDTDLRAEIIVSTGWTRKPIRYVQPAEPRGPAYQDVDSGWSEDDKPLVGTSDAIRSSNPGSSAAPSRD